MSDGISDGAVVSLFGDRLKRLWRRTLGQDAAVPAPAESQDDGSKPLLRRSSGLREFWKGIQGTQGLKILDLGAASQANISFITELGHKLYTADLLQSIVISSSKEIPEGEAASQVDAFFRENLNFADVQFDGILCWDIFDFVPDPLVQPLVTRLQRSLKPGGVVLSFFHTATVGQQIPMHQYRIRTDDTLQMNRRGLGQIYRHFNNRTIETLFREFGSLKFYLSRDNLREVISVR